MVKKKKKTEQDLRCQNCGKKLKWYQFLICKKCVRLLHEKLWQK